MSSFDDAESVTSLVAYGGKAMGFSVAHTNGAQWMNEILGAEFPCGFPESNPMPACAPIRGPMINCAIGIITTDEARGLIADMLKSIAEAEKG